MVAEANNRRLLLVAGSVCFMLLTLLLWLTADTEPTTPSTRRLFGLWRIRTIVPALALAVIGTGFLLAAWSRSRLLAYLSSVFAIVATLGALEALGAVGLVSWEAMFKPRVDELGSLGTKREPNIDKHGTTHQDTASAWGLPSDPIPFQYRTDRHGFRNAIDREGGEIILLGDSILVAALVPVEKTLGAQLEALTSRTTQQIALIGIAPQEEHELFWETAPDLKGKRVVQFIFEGNDLLDSRRFERMKSGGAAPTPEGGLLHDQIWKMLTAATDGQQGVHGLRVCTVNDQLYTFLWARNSFEGVESEVENITRSLDQFGERVRAAGGQYAVVFVPNKLHVLAGLCKFPAEGEIKDPAQHIGQLRGQLEAWGAKSGVPVLDLTDPLIAVAREGRVPWFWGDTHWNETGHEVAARALADWPALSAAP
jgi:hypothetical protein